MNMKTHMVLVQTDKAVYKPTDKVQFRVLVLDEQTKPIVNTKAQVFITDGGDNRIKQFDNINLSKGFFQSELQLSDSPVLGKWNIHTKLEGVKEFMNPQPKQFEVARDTLLTVEFTMDVNPNANFKNGKIEAVLKAKYTSGKMAKGSVTITAEFTRSHRWWVATPFIRVSKTAEFEG